MHNEFLQVLGDYGIVGLLLVLALLLLHIRNGSRFVRAYREFKPAPGEVIPHSANLAMAIGALSFLAGALTVSLFDFAMHLPAIAILASILLATLAAPDPMADALTARKKRRLIPGGGLVFTTRAVGFGCGLAMLFFGAVFSRSEYHFEKAKVATERGGQQFRVMRHLKAARTLDPYNPYALSLSAHAHVASITPEMAAPARRQALEQADTYFSQARRLYPQDVFAAVGHAAVLDELGQAERAKQRLEGAREWAPLYGNLMLAEAEHHLRQGDVAEAEVSFRQSLVAPAFRDVEGARQGLRTISEWKFIAMQNGIRWEQEGKTGSETEIASSGDFVRTPANAKIEERDLAGKAVSKSAIPGEPAIPEPAEWFPAERSPSERSPSERSPSERSPTEWSPSERSPSEWSTDSEDDSQSD
jgi:tetratricopeptide (TPR) repeat protein